MASEVYIGYLYQITGEEKPPVKQYNITSGVQKVAMEGNYVLFKLVKPVLGKPYAEEIITKRKIPILADDIKGGLDGEHTFLRFDGYFKDRARIASKEALKNYCYYHKSKVGLDLFFDNIFSVGKIKAAFLKSPQKYEDVCKQVEEDSFIKVKEVLRENNCNFVSDLDVRELLKKFGNVPARVIADLKKDGKFTEKRSYSSPSYQPEDDSKKFDKFRSMQYNKSHGTSAEINHLIADLENGSYVNYVNNIEKPSFEFEAKINGESVSSGRPTMIIQNFGTTVSVGGRQLPIPGSTQAGVYGYEFNAVNTKKISSEYDFTKSSTEFCKNYGMSLNQARQIEAEKENEKAKKEKEKNKAEQSNSVQQTTTVQQSSEPAQQQSQVSQDLQSASVEKVSTPVQQAVPAHEASSQSTSAPRAVHHTVSKPIENLGNFGDKTLSDGFYQLNEMRKKDIVASINLNGVVISNEKLSNTSEYLDYYFAKTINRPPKTDVVKELLEEESKKIQQGRTNA